jgi:hypothetical protein
MECEECWKEVANTEGVVCCVCYGELIAERNKYLDALQKIAIGTGTVLIDRYWLSKEELREIAQEAL